MTLRQFFYGPDDAIKVDSYFYDAVKVLGPSYNKDTEERIFHIKRKEGEILSMTILSMTKQQAKQRKLANVMEICGITERHTVLHVLTSKRVKPTSGTCSD